MGKMASVARGKAYERYAWILVVLGGLLWLVFGLSDLLLAPVGTTGSGYPDQAMNDMAAMARGLGAFILAGAVFQISLGANAFRRHEKWAWLAVIIVPVVAFLDCYIDFISFGMPAPGALGVFLIMGGLPLAAMLLTARTVFSSPGSVPVSPSQPRVERIAK
jgi:hypothetical protein